MLWIISEGKIHGWSRPDPWVGEERKKGKIWNTKKMRNMYFIWQTKLKQTFDALLDVESVTRDSWSPSPGPWMGGHVLWMGTSSMDLSTSRVKHSPSVYFILSVALGPFFNTIGPPHSWIFLHETGNRIHQWPQTSMDGDYPRVACNTDKDPDTYALLFYNIVNQYYKWPV